MANIPNCGCPWHGLVEGNYLTLEDGKGTRIYYGEGYAGAHLLDFGMPEPEISKEEHDAGMRWSNKALLHISKDGDTAIHGKSIGRTHNEKAGWIYHDSNGDNWLAIVNLHDYDQNEYKLTLRRFGVFVRQAGEQIEYTYFFTLPQSGIERSRVLGFIQAVRKDGAAALFVRHVEQEYVAPIGHIVEVSISGAGSDATVTVSILKNNAQCGGVLTTSETKLPESTSRWVYGFVGVDHERPAYPLCGDVTVSGTADIYEEDNPPEGAIPVKLMIPKEYKYNRRATLSDFMVSAWYNEDNSISYVTADYTQEVKNEYTTSVSGSCSITYSYYPDAGGASICQGGYQSAASGSAEFEYNGAASNYTQAVIKIDGVVMHTYSNTASLTESSSASHSFNEPFTIGPGNTNPNSPRVRTFVDHGGSATISDGTNTINISVGGGVENDFSTDYRQVIGLPIRGLLPVWSDDYITGTEVWRREWMTYGPSSLYSSIVREPGSYVFGKNEETQPARQKLGFAKMSILPTTYNVITYDYIRYDYLKQYIDLSISNKVTTPDGAKTIGSSNFPVGTRFAYNPITKELAVSSKYVFWT